MILKIKKKEESIILKNKKNKKGDKTEKKGCC